MINFSRIEETSQNAWPALQQIIYDGWLLRIANGYSRRSNSINVLYSGILELPHKVDYCEENYKRQGLPTIFRLTTLVDNTQLNALLAARGYAATDSVNVQVLDMKAVRPHFTGDFDILNGPTRWDNITWWQKTYVQMQGFSPEKSAAHGQIVRIIPFPACPMIMYRQEKPVCCGLAVLDGEYLGLFNLITTESERNKGYGRKLLANLLAWGKRRGAQYAYLQVDSTNTPALCLYAKAGFKDAYRYVYLIKK